MSSFSFSLSPEATGRVHDLLLCLAKFGEYVSLEARRGQLTFSTLNSSRTGYASFGLDPQTFFLSYDFDAGERFTCQMYNKALLAVFKSRVADARGGDTSIDRCEVSVDDQPDQVRCRMVVKMVCRHGVTKTYHLTYESVEVSHALFDRSHAPNTWKISARVLRDSIEYFAAKTENLNIAAKDGKAIFTSFTEKVMDGKELLKQPLETAITLHIEDFQDFHVEEDMHIVISVKDFRAIVTHAETLKGSISAFYSRPARPLQFFYQSAGMTCQFTLMTGGQRERSTSAPTERRYASTRSSTRQSSTVTQQDTRHTSTSTSHAPAHLDSTLPPRLEDKGGSMLPPPKPSTLASLREMRRLGSVGRVTSQATTSSDRDPESLFMPLDDDDRQWEPPNFDEEDEEEQLGWDAHADINAVGFHPTFRDTGSHARPTQDLAESNEGLPPTQRLSQMNGLFD